MIYERRKSKVLLWLQNERWCRWAPWVSVLKGEMRPLLCQCVIITSLREDSSKPFLLLTSSLTSCFPVRPASAGSAVTEHFIHNAHWWLQQERGQIQQPTDFKQYPTIYLYTVFLLQTVSLINYRQTRGNNRLVVKRSKTRCSQNSFSTSV